MSETSQSKPQPRGPEARDQADFQRREEQLFLDGEWQALVALYSERCTNEAQSGDAQGLADLHFRRGQLLQERVGDPDAAIEAYWTVAQLKPDHGGALRQLRRIHAARLEWDTVHEIVALEAETGLAPHERAASLAEIGEMNLTALGALDTAVERFQQALEIDPNQIDAMTGMARTLAALDQPRDAAPWWEKVVDHQRGPDRAIALVSLGELLLGPLQDADGAADCFRRALTDDPRNGRAVEALVQDAKRREQWELLADLSERRFSLAAGARKRTEIALEASQLQLDQLDNPATARLWLDRARELSPEDPRIASVCADIERRAGNRPALLAALERSLTSGEPTLAARLEAAELHSEAEDDERALEHLREAVLIAPSDPEVTMRLDECLRRLCRDADRVDVLERRVVLAEEDTQRAAFLAEIAHLQEEVLEDEEAAQRAWSRCFEHDIAHPEATGELITRLTKAEDWERLRGVLERAAELGPEAARLDMLCSLGDLAMLQFGDPEAAARAYEQALDREPRAPRALEGLARIAEGSGDDDAIARAYEREAEVTTDRRRLGALVWELVRIHDARGETEPALQWLERLHQAAPEDRACLDAIVSQHEKRDDLSQSAPWIRALEALQKGLTGPEQATARNRLVALHRRLDDEEAAIRWAEASLEAKPRQTEVARELVELYRNTRRHEDRARVQRRLVELLSGDEQAECLIDLAALVEEQLGDVDGAIVLLWRVASQPNCDPAVGARLAEMLERAGRYEELAQHLLEQRRRLSADAPEARALELRRAELLIDPLSQFDEAADEFRRLHAEDPSCAQAIAGLENALRAGRDTTGLAELLAERAAAADSPGERLRLELERVELLEEGGVEQADVRVAYAGLAAQQDNPEVARQASTRLEQLLERAGEWQELRERLEDTLEERDPDDELALRERLAAICRDRLNDRTGAVAHLEAAGEIAPQRALIWQALALLYDADEQTAELQRTLERELACELEPAREIALRMRAARLCRADDAAQTREHFERVLELEPGNAEACEFLVDHYGETGDHGRLVELLQARLTSTASNGSQTSQRTSLRLRIASLQADALDDVAAAIETLEPALDEPGARPVIAEPLADLLQRAERRDELVELCRASCRSELATVERAQWQLRLADALASSGRREEAVAAYCDVEPATPSGPAARDALRELYRELDRAEPLAELLLEQLCAPLPQSTPSLSEDSSDDFDPTPIHLELALLYADALHRPVDGLGQLRQVLAIDPAHAAALQRALLLAEDHATASEFEELLTLGLDAEQVGEARASLLRRRSALRAERLDRPDDAIADLREALAIDGQDAAARAALGVLYQQLERWPAALDCLFVQARQADATRRLELLEQGASLARDHLSIDASLPWLERLRAERPDDAETVARIAEVHRQAGRPEALLRTLERQIALTEEPGSARDLHVDRARILERDLASPGRALAAFEAANTSVPGDPAMLRELARLQGDLGFARERVVSLEQLLEVAEPSERAGLHKSIASICRDELVEHARARGHLVSALAATQDTAEERRLLQELGESLQLAGAAGEWSQIAERELALLEPGSDRAVALREELAECYAEKLAARERALLHWSALAAWAAQNEGRCSADRRDRFESEVIGCLRALRNPIELEPRLSEWVARHEHDTDVWLELARLRDEVLHAPAHASEAYRSALASSPDRRDALLGLRSVAERCGEFGEVADTLERELEQHPDASAADRGSLWRRLGRVAWQRLSDGPRAERALQEALAIDEQDLAAMRSLQQLHEARDAHSAALDLYERECELLPDEEIERKVIAWMRAGELARGFTNEPERALAAYEAAAELAQLPESRQREWADLLLACNQPERHAEIFAGWCDRPDSAPTAQDHLVLADHLTELGREAEALERTRAATRCNAEWRDAWDALARRNRAVDDRAGEADALERSARLSSGREACGRYVAAALAIEPVDPRRALGCLEIATLTDGADTSAHAHLARVAEHEECYEQAEQAAENALAASAGRDGDGAAESDAGLQLESALIAGRCARRRGDLDAAAIGFRFALRSQPDHAEALAACGEVLFEAGDAPAAREILERLLDQVDPSSASPTHLAIIGEALEVAGRDDEALARFEAAVAADPSLEAAQAGRIRCLGRANRSDDAIGALDGWAEHAARPELRAAAALQAARLEIELERPAAALQHLELASEHQPENAEVWIELAELHLAREDVTGALEAADRGLAHIDVREVAGVSQVPAAGARLERVRARALEHSDDAAAAADAWQRVIQGDPRDCEAALEHSRLLRTAGDWQAAAETLRAFAAQHPDPSVLELGVVHLELGRLWSGPLENVEGAIGAYERALVLDPLRTEARAKLASLLTLVPGRRRDAVAAQGELLAIEPTNPGALRGLLRVAQQDGQNEAVAQGASILGALGLDTDIDPEPGGAARLRALAETPQLHDRLHEQLRLCVREINEAFAALPEPASQGTDRVRRQLDAILAELGAARLDSLGEEDLRAALYGTAALALDPLSPHAETAIAATLDRGVGRRALRRARRQLEPHTLSDVCRIDVAVWRSELRGLAAAVALDRGECDLRSILIALIGQHRGDLAPGDHGDLCALAGDCPAARALLARLVSNWCRRIERAIPGDR